MEPLRALRGGDIFSKKGLDLLPSGELDYEKRKEMAEGKK